MCWLFGSSKLTSSRTVSLMEDSQQQLDLKMEKKWKIFIYKRIRVCISKELSSCFGEFKFACGKNQGLVFKNSSLHIETIKFMFLRIQICILKESSSCFWEFKFKYRKNQVHVFENSSLHIERMKLVFQRNEVGISLLFLIIVTFLIPCTQWRAWQGTELSNFYHCSEVWGRCQRNWWG